MTRSRKAAALLAAATLALVATPALAQEEEPAPEAELAGPTIAVSGVDYAFVGLPTNVPAGTSLTFQNDGTEMHEMAVVHVLDETTPLEELMAMPEEESQALVEFVGFVSAMPGTSAEDSVTLDAPGRYVALCFIPQGMDPAAFEAAGVDLTQVDENTDPSDLPPEAQELFASLESNPPHMALGMIQEFRVTQAGTDVGPLPEADAAS
jgi:plastocyanin